MESGNSVKAMIPVKISLDNIATNKSDRWLESDKFVVREFVTRLVYAVGGSALAFVSLVFNLAVFFIKLPVTMVRITFGYIPTKNGRFADRFPADTTVKELFKHAYKVVVCLLNVILTPVVGAVHPRAHNWVYHKMHVVVERKEVPYCKHDESNFDHMPMEFSSKEEKSQEGSYEIPQPPPPPPILRNSQSADTEKPQKRVNFDADALNRVQLKNVKEASLESPTREKTDSVSIISKTLDTKSHLLDGISDDSGEDDADGEWDVNTQTYKKRQAEEFQRLRKQVEEQKRLSEEKLQLEKVQRDERAVQGNDNETKTCPSTPPASKASAGQKGSQFGQTFHRNMLKRRQAVEETLVSVPRELKQQVAQQRADDSTPRKPTKRGSRPPRKTAMEIFNDLKNEKQS
jgi:hypothetical protein